MGNIGYYRWQYEKVTGANSSTIADIRTLKPRLIFPYLDGLLDGLLSLSPLSYSKVWLFNSMEKYYKVFCTPLILNNLALSNATCSVTDASEGSKPRDFGTGHDVATTVIYADSTAFLEYHCFVGNVQIFNVISLTKSLTDDQITAMKAVLFESGFKAENMYIYTNFD